jgi:hypothetical protein
MKVIALGLLAALPLVSPARADFEPAEWQVSPVAAAAKANEWYFYPDNAGAPRILVKSTAAGTALASQRLLTGGPPQWLTGGASKLGVARQGVFVPAAGGGGFLVAAHGLTLRAAVYDSAGNVAVETIDPNPGAYSGVSAELDASGILHVGYIYGGRTICYARRNSPGNWSFTSQLMPGAVQIHETAVVPLTPSNVSLYFNQSYARIRTLWRARPGVAPDGRLYILWAANPLQRVEDYVGLPLRGSRVGGEGRLYYFGSDNSRTWKLRRYNGSTTATLENAGFVSPKSIRVAIGPDGRQRVAWYNPTLRRVHYLKPPAAGADVPALAGYPVTTTGKQTGADLSGFHFTPDGTPCLLFRTTPAKGFVAFPREDIVWDGDEW